MAILVDDFVKKELERRKTLEGTKEPDSISEDLLDKWISYNLLDANCTDQESSLYYEVPLERLPCDYETFNRLMLNRGFIVARSVSQWSDKSMGEVRVTYLVRIHIDLTGSMNKRKNILIKFFEWIDSHL